ncbi:MAG TPA: ABC transporter permease subunit [Candidatus Nanopelagicaceae bacterium]|nr:ABC transporter permease subunit [Candidatus Nanopelagicaceae bacterium]
MNYNAASTMPFRVELRRQLRRKRTLVAYLFVAGLPLLVAAAVKFGPSNGRSRFGAGGSDLVGLATVGAANFTATMFYFATGFVLITVVAIFCGDTVASEASWSTLRYLLAAPVPRGKLLRTKMTVGLVLSLGALIILPIASYVVGGFAFGFGALQSPLGTSFSTSNGISRLIIMVIFLALYLLFTAGVAFFMSVITDAPLGAVGAAVGVVIVSNILDAISTLGTLREWLPTHYSYSWLDVFASQVDWNDMLRGASYSLIGFTIFFAAAIIKFRTKDITS